jgi:hypothetical protein
MLGRGHLALSVFFQNIIGSNAMLRDNYKIFDLSIRNIGHFIQKIQLSQDLWEISKPLSNSELIAVLCCPSLLAETS